MSSPLADSIKGRIRVLLIDDEESQIELAKLNLEEADKSLAVLGVSTPKEAFAYLRARPCDCVVSDYRMPVMDGVELCREIRKESRVPFILYTGRGSEEVASQAFAAGVDDYIRKEQELAHFQVLAKRIRHAVEKRRVEGLYGSILDDPFNAISISRETTIVYANQAEAHLHGAESPSELIGFDSLDWVVERDRNRLLDRDLRRERGEKLPRLFEYTIRKKDGKIRLIEASSSLITYNGEPATLTFHRDITDRRNALESLKASEERYRVLVENAPVGIYEIDFPTQRLTTVNEGLCRMLGYTEAELLTINAFDILDEESGRQFKERLAKAQSGEKLSTTIEYTAKRKDGVKRSGILNIKFNFRDGKIVGAFVVAQDITERKKAEEEIQTLLSSIQAERDRLSSLIKSMLDEVWFSDANGKLTLVNPSVDREFNLGNLGTDDVEKIAASFEVYRPDGTPRPFSEAPPLRALHGEEVKNQEEIVRTPTSGELRYRQVNASPVKATDGSIIGSVSVVRDITALKRIEQALLETEERFRVMADGTPTMLWVTNEKGENVFENKYYRDYLGVSPEMLDRDGWRSFYHPYDIPAYMERWAESVRLHVPFNGEARLRRADGEWRWVDTSASPRFSKDGVFLGHVGTTMDVTERREAREQLLDTLESIGDGFFALDGEWRFVYINRSAEHILGIKREDVLGRSHWEIFPLTLGTNLELEYRAAAAGEIRDFENFYEPWARWFHNRCYPRPGGGMSVYFRDTTEKKKVEDQIFHQSLMLQNAGDAIVGYNAEYEITYWNKMAEQLYGYTTQEAIGKLGLDILKATYPTIPREELIGQVNETGKNESESIRVTKDGRSLNVWTRVIQLQDKNGKPTGYVSIDRDITDRKLLEESIRKANEELAATNEELQTSEEELRTTNEELSATNEELQASREELIKYTSSLEEQVEARTAEIMKSESMLRDSTNYVRGLTEASLDPMVTINPEGKITDVNEATVRAIGLPRDVIIGSVFASYFTDPNEVLNARKKALAGESIINRPLILRNASGSTIDVLYNATLYMDAKGNVAGLLVVARDVTERNKLEKELRHREEMLQRADEMEAVSRLGAMLAHDLRNPLNSVISAAKAAKTFPDRSDRMLEIVQENAMRSLALVEALREHTKELTITVRPTDINELIKTVMNANAIPTSVRTEIHVGGELAEARVDPNILRRVLDNLVRNAVEAMPEGGKLTVWAAKDGEGLKLAVADTGVGIPDDAKIRLWEPFRTTKAKGMGLGLAFCKRAIESHGGKIGFQSVEGKGTVFTLTLPSV